MLLAIKKARFSDVILLYDSLRNNFVGWHLIEYLMLIMSPYPRVGTAVSRKKARQKIVLRDAKGKFLHGIVCSHY